MIWLLFILFSTGDVELVTLTSETACQNAGRMVVRLAMQNQRGAAFWCEEVSDKH